MSHWITAYWPINYWPSGYWIGWGSAGVVVDFALSSRRSIPLGLRTSRELDFELRIAP